MVIKQRNNKMKKTILAIISGMMLGLILVIGVFALLHVQSSDNRVFAQSIMETIGFADTEESAAIKTETVIEETFDMDTEVQEVESIDTDEPVVESEEDINTEVEDTETEVVKIDAPYYIKVNRFANCVTVYGKDTNGDYTVPVKAMVCSVGLNGKTPLGVGSISDKYEWRLLFGDVYGQYAVRFDGHIMFHSVPYTTTSKDALKDGEYNLLGQPASKGCVRLSVIDAKWIYDNCCKGTQVEVYDGADPGPLGKPAAIQIDPYHFFRGWDPTDPDPANPWKLYGIAEATEEMKPAA